MDLSSEQISAINEIDNNLQILACAGSGKTEVVTRRIANILNSKNEIKSKNIVAFTFTNKASSEMKVRIQKHLLDKHNIEEMFIGTIHSFCYNLLINNVDIFRDFKLLTQPQNIMFISRYKSNCGFKTLNLSREFDANLLINCIEKMVYDYSNYDKWSDINKKSFDEYRKCFYEHSYFDYSLLILEVVNQIKTNNIIKEYIKNIKYLVVDEYQDIDSLQEE